MLSSYEISFADRTIIVVDVFVPVGLLESPQHSKKRKVLIRGLALLQIFCLLVNWRQPRLALKRSLEVLEYVLQPAL